MTAEQILYMISTQAFADFYTESFEDYIAGETNAPSREDIIANLKEMMNWAK